MPAEASLAEQAPAVQIAGLERAFAVFTDATERLEREYGALRAHARRLTAELEEKNRLLAASLERERRLEAEALRQSRLAAMGEMAAMLAHEVRNPLGAMQLFTGLLLQDLEHNPAALRLARQVARGIADLDHLVSNLLEFTRTRTASPAPVDLGALAEDVLHCAAEACAAGAVTVVRAIATPPVRALADPDLLRPVLLNLVRNAVQAMEGGGTLTVSVARSGGGAAITIADTGPGIAPEAHEAIFRPFYTTRSKGTGLGLAVARELVRAMGGTLGVTSEIGCGAAFTVRLPVEERA
ncbi:MAG TPA: ATP-binding protein [Candidatus Binatia bacterium]|nr:ATP-binding protein [Candidatus Binatia bacterium]